MNDKYVALKPKKITFFIQVIDPELAEAVLTSQYRHMWYLTEELVIFSLADSGTSDDTKARVVASMLAAGRPQDFPPGKPVMKPELLRGRDPDAPQLHEFVGTRSWLIFHLFNLNVDWMQLPPAQWEMNADFNQFKNIVDNLNVVNDSAERAVKDVSDFADYSKDPNRRDDVVRVVNSHRELYDFANMTKDQLAML